MADEVQNLVLEQLGAIRADLAQVNERLDSLDAGQKDLTVILVNLAANYHDLDGRVERLEEKIGA